jgi:hypothetical protein
LLENLFTVLEKPNFSARLNVVSGLRSFVRALALQAEVRELSEKLQSPDAQREVFEHLMELASEPVATDEENPNDVALAAYTWLLNAKNQALARLAAVRIKQCPQYWWARKLAEHVESTQSFSSDAGTVVVSKTAEAPPRFIATRTDAAQANFEILAIPHHRGKVRVLMAKDQHSGIVWIGSAAETKREDFFENRNADNHVVGWVEETRT